MELHESLQLQIEPGLFEFLGIPAYQVAMPTWMTNAELVAAGYNINTNYTPVVDSQTLPGNETQLEYYNRSFSVVKGLLDRTKDTGIADVAIVLR